MDFRFPGRWLRRITIIIGLWWLLVTLTPIDLWWAEQYAKPWGDPGRGKVLVVLGGDEMPDSILGASSYLRSVYAVRAMREHHYDKVILSGGTLNSNPASPPVAQVMYDFLRGHGLDMTNVVVEGRSRSTRENAEQVLQLLTAGAEDGRPPAGKIILLTSDYHIRRAGRVFAKLGMDVETWPAPDVLKRGSFRDQRAALFWQLLLETGKSGWYWWRGWI